MNPECQDTIFHQSGGLICKKTAENIMLKDFCKELMEVVDFYGEHNNWINSDDHHTYPILIHKEQLNSGKRAREIQQTEMYKRMKG